LSHNTELQTLTVGWSLPYSPPNVIKSLLEPVSSSIRDVVFNAFNTERLNDDGSEESNLRGLDQIFCQPQFPQLQVIGFRIYGEYEEIERMIKLNMPACLSRGILSIVSLSSKTFFLKLIRSQSPMKPIKHH
jgi:hypothetical protein